MNCVCTQKLPNIFEVLDIHLYDCFYAPGLSYYYNNHHKLPVHPIISTYKWQYPMICNKFKVVKGLNISYTSIQPLQINVQWYIYLYEMFGDFIRIILAVSRSLLQQTELTVMSHDLYHVTQAGACANSDFAAQIIWRQSQNVC